MQRKIFLSLFLFVCFFSNGLAQKRTQNKDNVVTFYFVRHGKTILNTMQRAQGWADTPLTPEGVVVAEYVAKGLEAEGVEFTSAYCSDLGRARQTARIILNGKGQGNMALTEVADVRETNFGSYEGGDGLLMFNDAALYLKYKSANQLMEAIDKNPELLRDALGAIKDIETLGIGENYDDVKARGQKAIRQIAEAEAQKNGNPTVLLVGHGMSLGIFLSDLDASGKKPGTTHMGNAAVSKVTYKDGKFYLESFGDMSYIEKGKSIPNK